MRALIYFACNIVCIRIGSMYITHTYGAEWSTTSSRIVMLSPTRKPCYILFFIICIFFFPFQSFPPTTRNILCTCTIYGKCACGEAHGEAHTLVDILLLLSLKAITVNWVNCVWKLNRNFFLFFPYFLYAEKTNNDWWGLKTKTQQQRIVGEGDLTNRQTISQISNSSSI